MEDLISSYDEMVTGEGSFRPHWRALMHTLRGLSPQQLAEKQARAALQIADADAFIARTIPPSGSPGGRMLDLLPLVLPGDEWRAIEAGLVQRARLLNAILTDLYGAQRLVAERRIPPGLVFASPAFLRPLRGVAPVAQAPHLYFYAADLIRLPSGEWRVFSDRSQAPGGVGYALHHRDMLARVLPEAFRAVAVRPLRPFIESWRQSLYAVGSAVAPDGPRVALLTPGPYNDAYFEHVLLARELGISLAQSANLTVRGDFVYLKTLQGLSRVDAIYRRVDGDYSDSLELREDSELGVAGLIEVVRKGHVAVLNMPGAALVETPALTAFLPELSRHLLGEELRLHAVTTWWCGQQRALAEVTAAFDRFALQPVFEPDPELIEPATLSPEARARFEATLAARPEGFVAREKMAPSITPSLASDQLQQGKMGLAATPVVLRVACVWHGGEWHALPGGVARVVSDHSIYRNALRPGGVTKDVWVLADDDRRERIPVSATAATARHTGEDTVLRSRTADDLYWLGRYVERLESGTRLFLAAFRRLAAGGIGARAGAELARLAEALKRTGWIDSALAATPVDSAMFLDAMTGAAASGTMLRATIDSIMRLTMATRDQLSPEMWQTQHRLAAHAIAHFNGDGREVDALIESLERTIATIAAVTGLAAENMVRGPGWRFLDLGRRIERGIDDARATVGVMSGPVAQYEAGLRLALELCDVTSGLLRSPFELDLGRSLHFVLAASGNPRSLLYQLDRISRHLAALEQMSGASVAPVPIPALTKLIASFPDDLPDPDRADAVIAALFERLNRTVADLAALSDGITRSFFSQVAAPHRTGISAGPFERAR